MADGRAHLAAGAGAEIIGGRVGQQNIFPAGEAVGVVLEFTF
ncbi:hypothetical protein ACQFN5_23045 [Klebsiella sp. WOUb02]